MQTEFVNNLNTFAPSHLRADDFMLLFQNSGLESAEVNEMLTKAKHSYVLSHHSATITHMHSSNKYKDGNWKTYVESDGKRKEVVRKTKDELIETLYTFYKEKEAPAATFEDVFKGLSQRKRDQLGRSYQTISDDARYFSFLDENLKKKPVAEVTEADLRTWLVKKDMPTKPKETALRKMLQLLKQIFSFGMSQKLCFGNPAEYILFDDYSKECNHTKKRDEDRAFSVAECDMLRKDALSTLKNPRALMRLLAMATGMRAGELSALQWCDILDDYIHIHRQQIRDVSSGHQVFYDVEYTKDERRHNHGGRYIPRTQDINEVLEYAKGLDGESQYVFHDKKGNAVSKDSYEQNLYRACGKLGISTSNNHAFRIAFNSKLIEKGLSPADRALILGHAVQTNEHHYSISDRRRLDDIKQKMA